LVSSSFLHHYDETKTLLKSQPQIWATGADGGHALISDYAELGAAGKVYAILPTNVSVEPLALGIRKGEEGVKTAVDATLRALEKSGEAEMIFLKWYGPGTTANFDKRSFKFETDEIDR